MVHNCLRQMMCFGNNILYTDVEISKRMGEIKALDFGLNGLSLGLDLSQTIIRMKFSVA